MASSHSYTHTQVTPSTDWTIVHGLNTRPIVNVQVLFEGTIQTILPKSVEFLDLQTVVVRFTTARAGYARLV